MFGRCNYPYVRICIYVLAARFPGRFRLRTFSTEPKLCVKNPRCRMKGNFRHRCYRLCRTSHGFSSPEGRFSVVLSIDMITVYTNKHQLQGPLGGLVRFWLSSSSHNS